MADAPRSDPSALSLGIPPSLLGGSAVYFSGEDGLQLSLLNAASGVTVRVAGRFLGAGAGRVTAFARDVKPTTDRTLTQWWIPLGEGWLLDASAFVTAGTPQHGQCWARLATVRGGPSAGMELSQLTHGYITTHRYIGFPLGVIEAPLDGPGAIRSITGTQPAAGANISETVPTGARWELIAASFSLTTSATVATRVVSLLLDDGTNTVSASSAQTTETASQSITYTASQAAGSGFSNSDNKFLIPVPEGIRLPAGFRIRTSTANIQAGDQYSADQLLVREWMAGE